MSNNVSYNYPDKAFKFLEEEDSETEEKVVKPKTKPESPDPVSFDRLRILPKKNYPSSDDIREIKPSAISTPSTSISSRENVRKKEYSYTDRSWGHADTVSMDRQQTDITTLGSSSRTLAPDRYDIKTENDNKTIKRWFKYSVAVAVILIGITAVIVVIVTNKDQKYPQPTVDKQTSTDGCGIYLLNLVQYGQPVNIEFNCTFTNNVVSSVNKIKIKFKPTYRYLSTSENIEEKISLSEKTEQNISMTIKRWNINCTVDDKHLKCGLEREPVRCDNGGVASVTLYNNTEELHEKEVEFDVEGEVSKVEMEINQTIDERDNSTIVDIACSTKSSCTPTSIWLFSKKDGMTERRYDINFTCIIEYNTQDGTTVDCTGSIPGSLLQSFGTILCRPQLNDSVEAETKEASVRPPVCIGDECTFSCPDEEGDIFYMDPLDCTVYNRCVNKQFYSGPCANSTYFNPSLCSCDHQDNVEGCDDTGMRVTKLNESRCGGSTIIN